MSEIINSRNFQREVLSEDKMVLVDFFSETCPPCRMMSPVIDQIGRDNIVKAVKVNVANDAELAQSYEVEAVPTMILFKNGREVSRIVGAVGIDKLLFEIGKFK